MRNLTLKGRLAPGVSQAAAQAELTTIAADLARAYPDTNKNQRWAVRTELQARIAQSPPDAMLVAMLATLALRGPAGRVRQRRGAADQPRAGARARDGDAPGDRRRTPAAGPAAGHREPADCARGRRRRASASATPASCSSGRFELPTDLPVLLTFQMDQRALVFSLAVSVVSAVLFGLLPAIQATRADLTARDEGRRRRRARPPPPLGANAARGRPGGRLGRAARRRALHVPRLQQPARQRARAIARITC